MKPHRATLILVFGILGLVSCLPLGIAAWIMGNADLRLMDAGQMDPAGRDTTKTGKILGIVSVCLYVAGLVIFGIIVALGLAGAAASEMAH